MSQVMVSVQNPGTGDSALRPATSSTLATHPLMERESSSRRESLRPPTSSTSSVTGTQPEWDPTGQSYYGSRATVGSGLYETEDPTPIDKKTQTSSEIDDLNPEPDEFWPRSDSDDENGRSGDGGGVLKRASTAKTGNTARKIKAMLRKFGRSYNKRYEFLPNDAQEKDRCALQHNIVLDMLDGRLHLAPVVNARRVLDLGCSLGSWPLDFARRNPNTFVLGVDIDPITPPYSLPNCRFHVTDFNEKWSYGFKFDFIHLRHLGDLPQKSLIATIYENLSPGGWGEFTEWIVSIQSTHNSFTETSFYKWLKHWKTGLKKVGTTVHYPLQYKQLLTEAGFKNVTERKYAVPLNPWPPGKQLQKIGSMMSLNINTILEPLSMPIFTGVLGWTPDAVKSLLTEVRKDLANVEMHAYMTLFTVYAQKPRGESSSGSSTRSSEHG